MTVRPSDFPDWARIAQNDPISGGANIVDPPSEQKDTGWLYKQKPPSSWFNWLLNLTGKWLHYLDEQTSAKQTAYICNATSRDGAGATKWYDIIISGSPTLTSGVKLIVNFDFVNQQSVALSIDGAYEYDVQLPMSNSLSSKYLIGHELHPNRPYEFTLDITNNTWWLSSAPMGSFNDLLNNNTIVVCSAVDIRDYIASQISLVLPVGMRASFDLPTSSPPSGWIPDITGTIGSSASGASIRANADCFNLYQLWWNSLSYDPVIGNRGANAAADFNANKLMNVPTTANRVISNASGSGNGIGVIGGSSTMSLNEANNGRHRHTITTYQSILPQNGDDSHCWVNTSLDDTGYSGNGTSFSVVQPTYYTNIFIKL